MFSYRYSVHNGGVYIGSNDLVKWVKEVVESLKNGDIGDYRLTGSGDSMVIAFKQEDGIRVLTIRNYVEFKVQNDEIEPGWDKYIQGVLDSLEVG